MQSVLTVSPRSFLLSALLLYALAAAPPCLRAQEAPRTDSTAVALHSTVVTGDTAAAKPDTIKPIQSSSGIDSVVTYTAADSIVYALSRKTMYLFGKADIHYKDLALKAQKIDINWTTSLLNAGGTIDTADTSGKKLKGIPELIDGSEVYHGETITYNFKSKKGKIDLGKTEIEKGLYYGQEIKKEIGRAHV